LGSHPQTILSWYAYGLKKIDNHHPSIVYGQDLKDFIEEQNRKHKHKCGSDELFCCKCRQSRRSKNNAVSIKCFKNRVNVIGSCEKCGTQINKTISPNKVIEYKNIFVVASEHKEDLIECANTSAITIKNEKEICG